MHYTKTQHTTCAICGFEAKNGKKLSFHVYKEHKLRAQEYTIKHLYGGVRPMCSVCGDETRYVSYTFKKFCKKHRSHAESEGGKKGGLTEAWNRGLTKETDERVAEQAKNLEGQNNPFYGRKHTKETKHAIADTKRLSFETVIERIGEKHSNVLVLSDASAYKTNNSKLSILCTVCGIKHEVSYWELMIRWLCKVCNPSGSLQQHEISMFVREILGDEANVIVSTRSIIAPLELDVWVPEKRVAIEYHGLYWHSGGRDDNVYDPESHKKKHKMCVAKGIRLIQVFGDEWKNKREICKSMISNALGVNECILNARECTVHRVDVKSTKQFLIDNHISGAALASYHYTLLDKKSDIVGVLTLRRPNNYMKKYNGMLEIARLAFKKGTTVRGGASKLIKAASTDVKDKCEGLLTYADLRFGEGSVYEHAGFNRIDDTQLNYWYTDGSKRIDRSKVRATQEFSEYESAKQQGLRKIYGCGNAVYIMGQPTMLSCNSHVVYPTQVCRSSKYVIDNVEVNLDDHQCKECGRQCINKKSVGIHVRKSHSMTLQQYVLKHFFGNIVPKCACGCGDGVTWHKTMNKYNTFINGHNAYKSIT